jgi:membrane protease YdiL (CAAX protease family)
VTEAAAPATPTTDGRRWGLGDVAIGWGVVQVVAGLWAAAVLGLTGHADEEADLLPLDIVALTQLGLAGAMFAVPYVVTRRKGNGIVADLHLRARWGDLSGVLAGALLQFPGLVILYWPILLLFDQTMDDVSDRATAITDRADSPLGVVLLVLIVGLLAPVFEEIFYRGFVQQGLLNRGLPPVVAIAGSSLVFGASHFQLLQLPGLVAAGALFGVLAYRYDRLGPAIAAHIGFNLVAVTSLLAS